MSGKTTSENTTIINRTPMVANPEVISTVVGLRIVGKSMNKIAKLLDIHRDTVRRILDTAKARELVSSLKNSVLLMGPKATEVIAEDLTYEGDDHQMRQLRNKTAIKILQAPEVLPRSGQENIYIQDNLIQVLAPEVLKILGSHINTIMADDESLVPEVEGNE